MNRRYYEHFQEGDSIDAAYKSVTGDSGVDGSKKSGNSNKSSGSKADTSKKKDSSNSTLLNLWEYLGLNNMDNKQKGCMFDCSIEGSKCLKKCSKKNNTNTCNYGCSSKGLKCVKKCVIPTEKPKTTQATTTQAIDSKDDENEDICMVKNTYDNNNDNYAPFDSKLWPQFSYNNMGWNMEDIDEHKKSTGEEEIEVQVHNYYPFQISKKKTARQKKNF